MFEEIVLPCFLRKEAGVGAGCLDTKAAFHKGEPFIFLLFIDLLGEFLCKGL